MTGPAPDVTIRRAGPGDRRPLEDALVWAFNWSPDRAPLAASEVLSRPENSHYVAGWPCRGDLGFVAEAAGRGPVGAVWLRYLPADDPGYGFVADDVPELTIGVDPDHRGRGIGRRLLRSLLAAAAAAGIARVSLSVERGNRARRLYLSEGFRLVGARTGLEAGADRMLAEPGRTVSGLDGGGAC